MDTQSLIKHVSKQQNAQIFDEVPAFVAEINARWVMRVAMLFFEGWVEDRYKTKAFKLWLESGHLIIGPEINQLVQLFHEVSSWTRDHKGLSATMDHLVLFFELHLAVLDVKHTDPSSWKFHPFASVRHWKAVVNDIHKRSFHLHLSDTPPTLAEIMDLGMVEPKHYHWLYSKAGRPLSPSKLNEAWSFICALEPFLHKEGLQGLRAILRTPQTLYGVGFLCREVWRSIGLQNLTIAKDYCNHYSKKEEAMLRSHKQGGFYAKKGPKGHNSETAQKERQTERVLPSTWKEHQVRSTSTQDHM